MVIQFLIFLFALFLFTFLFLKLLFRIEILDLNDQTRSSLPGQFIQLPSGITHFEFQGNDNAPVIVLVHGFSTPYYIWDPTFEALAAAGFKVLRFDLFGRGFSNRPLTEYDVQFYRTQLNQLFSALEIKKPVHLIGLSFGGPIVADFAKQFPMLVRSLTFVDPLVTTAAFDKFHVLDNPIVGKLLVAFYLVPFVLPKSQSIDFYQPKRFPDWESRYREQMQYKGFSRSILSTFRSVRKMNPESDYRAIGKSRMPVLSFWGEHDQTISWDDMRQLESFIPQMNLHIIKNAGHIPHYEQPDFVNKILINFLRDNK